MISFAFLLAGQTAIAQTATGTVASAANTAPSTANTAPSKTAAAVSPKVEVIIEGVEARGGNLLVALYQNKDSWLKVDRAKRVQTIPAPTGRAAVGFDDVEPGEYAIAVIHDVNRNRKLDMKWFPIPGPAEGAAASNDPSAAFGPPSYKEARIDVSDQKKVVRVKMRY